MVYKIGNRIFLDEQTELIVRKDLSTLPYRDPAVAGYFVANSEYLDERCLESALPEIKAALAVQEEMAHRLVSKLFMGRVDKGNHPYLEHLEFVQKNSRFLAGSVIGLLHDSMEDCGLTRAELLELGFDSFIVDAVEDLTRPEGMDYLSYIENLVARNPYAMDVKLADLRHNRDLTRLQQVTEKDMRRLEKYNKAESIIKRKLPEGY